jgi:hypothetical protein
MRAVVLCLLGLTVADVRLAIARSLCDLTGSWQCTPGHLCSPSPLARIEPKSGEDYWFTNEKGQTTSAVHEDGRSWRTEEAPGWAPLPVTASPDCNMLDFHNGTRWVR